MPRITIHEPEKTPQPYRFDINTPSVYLGRGEGNGIVLESGSISGRHAVMMRVPGGFELRDLGSTNGIEKNGVPVQIRYLNDGDQLKLGDVAFTFELVEGEAAALAEEVASSVASTKTDAMPVDQTPEDDDSRAPRRGVPGWLAFLAFLLFGSVAFFFGASLRHKHSTGTSYVELIMTRLTTPDLNRLRRITGEDSEALSSRLNGPAESPVTVEEELPPEMEGWENRESREEEGADSGYDGPTAAPEPADSEEVETPDAGLDAAPDAESPDAEVEE